MGGGSQLAVNRKPYTTNLGPRSWVAISLASVLLNSGRAPTHRRNDAVHLRPLQQNPLSLLSHLLGLPLGFLCHHVEIPISAQAISHTYHKAAHGFSEAAGWRSGAHISVFEPVNPLEAVVLK